jgi:predicted transcriptional regulator of viral defense system
MSPLQQFGIIPVDYSALAAVFNNYKSPGDKITMLEKQEKLIRLKKGLYVVSPKVNQMQISRELIANHLYGPSYVSLESALSYYKLIPERVNVVRSVTFRRANTFITPLGTFDYSTVPGNYYHLGISQMIIDNQFGYLIASPEKALCDLIGTTPGLRIQSVKAMRSFLEEDLRIDLDELEKFNQTIIKQCAESGKKKNELTLLYKFMEKHLNQSLNKSL